jgi:hypothetical protein
MDLQGGAFYEEGAGTVPTPAGRKVARRPTAGGSAAPREPADGPTEPARRGERARRRGPTKPAVRHRARPRGGVEGQKSRQLAFDVSDLFDQCSANIPLAGYWRVQGFCVVLAAAEGAVSPRLAASDHNFSF